MLRCRREGSSSSSRSAHVCQKRASCPSDLPKAKRTGNQPQMTAIDVRCRAAQWPDCAVARLRCGPIAPWPDCAVARLRCGPIVLWPNRAVARLRRGPIAPWRDRAVARLRRGPIAPWPDRAVARLRRGADQRPRAFGRCQPSPKTLGTHLGARLDMRSPRQCLIHADRTISSPRA